MNTQAISFKRYWEPTLPQTAGVSLIAGTIATTLTYPFEFLKTVIQFQSTAVGFRDRRVWYQGYNPFRILRELHSTGAGLSGLFTGFDAHLFGRLTYLAVRNTIYTLVYNYFKPVKPYNDLTYREKAVIGGFAGAIGAVASNPFTVISIRQILDGYIRPDWRRNYNSTSVLNALAEVRAGGDALVGLRANIIRHVLLNVSLTGPYDYFKEGFYTRFGDYGFVQPLALVLASFISSFVTLPIDNIRTKIVQLQKQPERNRLNFSGIVDGLQRSFLVETHPLSLWAGFYTYFPSVFLYAYLTVGITETFT